MPSLKSSLFLGALASVSLVDAHGLVTGIVADGKYHGGYLVNKYPYQPNPPKVVGWSTTAKNLGFIDGTGYSKPDIICHKDGKNAAISAEVAAGGSIELQWTKWPESHHGPVIDYLANCNGDCASVDKTKLKFFKIAEKGLIDGSNAPGTWASDELIKNNQSWSLTIPKSIAPGNYVLRHEIIALHSAGEQNGAQNYPQCINLKVTGSGNEKPEGTLGTALYKNTDPGIKISIYKPLDKYEIPGPKLIGGGPSPTDGAPTETAAPTGTATPTETGTTTEPAPPTNTGAPTETATETQTVAPTDPAPTKTSTVTQTVDPTKPAPTEPAPTQTAPPTDPTPTEPAPTGTQPPTPTGTAPGGGDCPTDPAAIVDSLNNAQLKDLIFKALGRILTGGRTHARMFR